jgi:hypothetical protein
MTAGILCHYLNVIYELEEKKRTGVLFIKLYLCMWVVDDAKPIYWSWFDAECERG